MEAIIRAATELGVTRIVPALTARTVVSLDGGPLARARAPLAARGQGSGEAVRARRRPRGDGAAAAGRGPSRRPAASDLRICLWEGERRPLGEILQAAAGAPRAVALAVGPEGGLSADEVAQARDLDWAVAGLGPRILRTETASLTALALIEAAFGDLLGPPGGVS